MTSSRHLSSDRRASSCDGEPRIYAPVLLAIATLVLLGRRFTEDTLRARLAQYAVGYIAVLWIYRFSVDLCRNRDLVGLQHGRRRRWPSRYPVILDELERTTDRRTFRVVLAAVLGGAAIATAVIRNANATAVDLYDDLRDNVPAVIAILVLAVALAVAAATRSGRAPVRAAAAAGFFVARVTIVGLMPARYIGIGQTGEFAPHGRSELWGYQAAYDMAKLLEETDQPDSRTLLWINRLRAHDRGLDESASSGGCHPEPRGAARHARQGGALGGVARPLPDHPGRSSCSRTTRPTWNADSRRCAAWMSVPSSAAAARGQTDSFSTHSSTSHRDRLEARRTTARRRRAPVRSMRLHR